MDNIIGITAGALQYPGPTPAPGPAPAPENGAATGTVTSGPVVVVSAPVPDVSGNVASATNGVNAAGNPNAKPAAAPTIAQVQKAVDDINSTLKANQNTSAIQFAIDPSSKKIVVQMIDTQSGKVLSQYPSEQIIQMGLTLGKKMGQLINQQA